MFLELCLFVSVFDALVATSTLTSTLYTDCACYGNDPTVDSILPDCSSTNGLIAIDILYRVAKLSSTGCPNLATVSDRDEANCCTYNSADDCRILQSYSDPLITDVYNDCAGVTSCSKQVTWEDASSDCPTGYLPQTNFMCVDYFCFPTLDTATFCDLSGGIYTGSQLFVYNDNYPAAISQSGCCACAVRSTSSTIDINIIDFRLHDATSACVQYLKIEDVGILTTYDCANNNDFNVQYLMTSFTNSITVTLENNAGTTNGHMWIGMVAMAGTLTMTCGPVASCPSITTSSTTPTTATTSSATSSTSATTPTTTITMPTTTSPTTTPTTTTPTTTTTTTTPTTTKTTTTANPTTTSATTTTTTTTTITTPTTTMPPTTTTTAPTTTPDTTTTTATTTTTPTTTTTTLTTTTTTHSITNSITTATTSTTSTMPTTTTAAATTPTTTTPLTTTSTTTTASSSQDTLLFGLSVLESVLILAGGFLLFLLLAGIAGCCIGNMCGNNKSYSPNERKTTKPKDSYKTKTNQEKDIPVCDVDKKQKQTMSSPYFDPYSTSKPTMARISMREPRLHDVSGNMSFSYRQFVNPNNAHNINRRGSMPRVVL